MTQGNADAEMRDAVEVVHRAIDRIDDPLKGAGLIPRQPLLPVNGMIRKRLQQNPLDHFLTAHIEFQLDVVFLHFIHHRHLAVMGFDKGTGGLRRVGGSG